MPPSVQGYLPSPPPVHSQTLRRVTKPGIGDCGKEGARCVSGIPFRNDQVEVYRIKLYQDSYASNVVCSLGSFWECLCSLTTVNHIFTFQATSARTPAHSFALSAIDLQMAKLSGHVGLSSNATFLMRPSLVTQPELKLFALTTIILYYLPHNSYCCQQ